MHQILHPHFKDKKHIIWDWNGTLLKDIERAVQATNRILEEEKLPPLTVERYREIFRFPVIEYYRDLGFDVSPESFEELCERFHSYFYEGLDASELWPGAREMLMFVKASGRMQSLLSASEQNLLKDTILRFELDHLFDHIYGIEDKAAASKIHRGHKLIEAAGIARAQTVLVGDTDHDLEVGKALEIDVILLEHGHQHPSRLRAIHETVLKIF